MVDIIQKKRDKGVLSTDEIQWMIAEYTANNIPDYQLSALLMAIYLHDMTRAETVALTSAMAHSGQLMDLSAITDYAVDKHSSGGVGDKTTLIVLPLVSACGVSVAKMSGRGLGFSGGTLDKLEAIAGFNVRLSEEEFGNLARQHGIVLCGQTGELAPADGKLYALRDVTATVPSLPLIASSIMSKKLASGANGIVLDVKWGNGAFMNTLESARELAQVMVDIGTDAGRDMIAVLSDMNQPLGYAIGNALEVVEAIETLHGGGAHDLREHCLHIAKYMLQLAGRGKEWTNEDDTLALLTKKLDNGEAFAKFRLMVQVQGGDVRMIDNPDLLPKATHQIVVNSPQSGIIASVNAEKIARAGLALGAGRMKKEDNIDLAVGVVTRIKVGDSIQSGTPIANIHANDLSQAEEAQALVLSAVEYSTMPVEPLPLFYGVIHGKK
jgi:pyrimidine-nucleoside phosphorylase